jgi:hypothetical protein
VCPHCGEAIQEKTLLCPQCGKSVAECKYHQRPAAAVCARCGTYLCQEFCRESKDEILCALCAFEVKGHNVKINQNREVGLEGKKRFFPMGFLAVLCFVLAFPFLLYSCTSAYFISIGCDPHQGSPITPDDLENVYRGNGLAVVIALVLIGIGIFFSIRYRKKDP